MPSFARPYLIAINLITMLFAAPTVKAQTYAQDTLAVRLTLNQNGHFDVPMAQVTTLVNGRVQNLRFDSLPIFTFSVELFYLDSLKSASMVHCGLTSLPAAIAQWKSLTSIHLRDNSLSSLPEEIGTFTNLTQLNLRGNNLTVLPASVTQLKSLLYLDIGSNLIKQLPNGMDSLYNLVHLIADQDSLTELPDNLARLPFLRTLNVSGNRLGALPFQLAALDSLESLDLSYNEITSLPEAFVLLENLKSLDLAGNQVCAASPSLMAWAEARQPGWYATQLCVDSSQGASLRAPRRFTARQSRSGLQARTDFGLPGRSETFDARGRTYTNPRPMFKDHSYPDSPTQMMPKP